LISWSESAELGNEAYPRSLTDSLTGQIYRAHYLKSVKEWAQGNRIEVFKILEGLIRLTEEVVASVGILTTSPEGIDRNE
jgi:hypothetical protein